MFRCCVPDFCSSPLIGLYLLCTACTAHRACSSFFLNKGKGIGSPICRAAPRGCRRPCTPSTNTARAQGRGIKGGEAPFAGGPGTRRSLVSLCLLSSHKKVGRGAGRSARRWVQGLPVPHKLPGRGAELLHIRGRRGCQLLQNPPGGGGALPLSPPADKNNLYILPLLCYFK